MPNALIEAMSLGLACISTDCPSYGPRDLIRDGENGFLVPVDRDDIMAEKLAVLMSDPSLCARLGAAAARVQELYNPDRINRQWLDYLKGLMCPVSAGSCGRIFSFGKTWQAGSRRISSGCRSCFLYLRGDPGSPAASGLFRGNIRADRLFAQSAGKRTLRKSCLSPCTLSEYRTASVFQVHEFLSEYRGHAPAETASAAFYPAASGHQLLHVFPAGFLRGALSRKAFRCDISAVPALCFLLSETFAGTDHAAFGLLCCTAFGRKQNAAGCAPLCDSCADVHAGPGQKAFPGGYVRKGRGLRISELQELHDV